MASNILSKSRHTALKTWLYIRRDFTTVTSNLVDLALNLYLSSTMEFRNELRFIDMRDSNFPPPPGRTGRDQIGSSLRGIISGGGFMKWWW